MLQKFLLLSIGINQPFAPLKIDSIQLDLLRSQHQDRMIGSTAYTLNLAVIKLLNEARQGAFFIDFSSPKLPLLLLAPTNYYFGAIVLAHSYRMVRTAVDLRNPHLLEGRDL